MARGAVGPGEGPEARVGGLWGAQLETSGVRRRQHETGCAAREGTERRCESVCVEERAAQRPRRQCGSATWLCAAEEAHGMLWKDVGRLGESFCE